MLTRDSYPFPGSSRNSEAAKPGHREAASQARSLERTRSLERPGVPSGVLIGVSELEGVAEFGRVPDGLPALRILVVDDDAPVRKACCEIASGMGFVPLSAGSVPEARAVLKAQTVDMLLLDLKLPGG